MDKNEFIAQQFATLRHEIEGQQVRAFWIVVIGLLGIPALSYFLLRSESQIWMALPFFLLVLIVLFLAQQNHMMRAGRYIREFIEPNVNFSPGWEEWIESRPELRVMDKQFSSCFVVMFFLYYFLLIAYALNQLAQKAVQEGRGWEGWSVFFGAVVVYGIATIWGISTLFQHWRSAWSTKVGPKGKPGSQ
jgi:hypothetical protein